MSTTVKQMMRYLSGYPDDARIGTMVVDTKNRKKYQIKDGNWLDMFSSFIWYWMSEKRAIWMPLKKQWHVNAKSRRY